MTSHASTFTWLEDIFRHFQPPEPIPPATGQAFQMTARARCAPQTWPIWLQQARRVVAGRPGSVWPRDDQSFYLGTTDGPVVVPLNAWLVCDASGTLSVQEVPHE